MTVKLKKALVLLNLTIVACTGPSIDKHTDDWLHYRESRIINDIPLARVRFSSLTDSRCPDGVNCFWAGNATVGLELTGASTEGIIRKQIELCIGPCDMSGTSDYRFSDTLTTSFGDQNYQFILLGVVPPPKTDSFVPAKEYAIKLKVVPI
ncbi:hypothetical protein [Dyadobacter tibetensis]|uniref:hypothetical protein n=1 Tax=Dyadobacter tibetensis TaxID=1211851 RepID=UPI0004725D20|nr:hypothetical protein [Dyadobacter tibetensis]